MLRYVVTTFLLSISEKNKIGHKKMPVMRSPTTSRSFQLFFLFIYTHHSLYFKMRPKKFNERGLKTLIFGDFWAPLLFSSPFFDPVYRHGGPPLFSGGPAQMTFPILLYTPWEGSMANNEERKVHFSLNIYLMNLNKTFIILIISWWLSMKVVMQWFPGF